VNEVELYLKEQESESYSNLVKMRDQLTKDYPKLVTNAWLAMPTGAEEYILVVTFTSTDPNNPVSECLVSNQYEDPEFCFDDLGMEYIAQIMNAPLITGHWMGQ
jgi:hypothetical protein